MKVLAAERGITLRELVTQALLKLANDEGRDADASFGGGLTDGGARSK